MMFDNNDWHPISDAPKKTSIKLLLKWNETLNDSMGRGLFIVDRYAIGRVDRRDPKIYWAGTEQVYPKCFKYIEKEDYPHETP